MKAVYVVGTLDTKREELAYVRDVIEATGVVAVARRRRHDHDTPVGARRRPARSPLTTRAARLRCRLGPRQAVGAMAVAFEAYVRANEERRSGASSGSAGREARR